MFEIGPALREARERRGISLQQVEAETAIRTRYIRALEDEEFGALPGTTYAKGFLRAYAEYLGLDGQLFIDEFNSRYLDPRADLDRPIYPRPRSRPQQRRRQRRESNLVMIVLAAIVAVSALVVLGFMDSGQQTAPLGGPNTDDPTPFVPQATPTASIPAPPTTRRQRPRHEKKPHERPAPTAIRVVLSASSRSWLQASRGTATGAPVSSTDGSITGKGFIEAGQTLVFRSRTPIVLTIGAPGSVTVRLNGKLATLPGGSLFRFTARGVSAA